MSKEMVVGNLGVTILGRAGLRYRDGARTASFDGEILTGPVNFVVFLYSVRAWDDSTPVGSAEQAQIVANIRMVCAQHGVTVEFQ